MELLTCSHSVPVINALTNTCTLSRRGVHAYVLLVSPWLNVLQTGLACGGTIFRQICLSPQMQKLWYFSVLYYDRCWTYLTCFGFIRIASFKKISPSWSSTFFCGWLLSIPVLFWLVDSNMVQEKYNCSTILSPMIIPDGKSFMNVRWSWVYIPDDKLITFMFPDISIPVFIC